jgi:hypothetical protein
VAGTGTCHAEGLERGDAGDGEGGGLFEGEAGGLGGELSGLAARVFGEGAVALAEDFDTGLQFAHLRADRLDGPGGVPAADTMAGTPESDLRTDRCF